ncbi:MAG: carbohydrate ABC transporter permease [Caldilineaceae bacterium]
MNKQQALIGKAVTLYLLVVIVGAMTALPFVWMLSTSFKLPSEAITVPPEWIPHPFTGENYTALFTSSFLSFPRFIFNSLKIAVLVVIGRLLICALGGYGFARLDFPGRDAAFTLLLASLMIPGMVMVFPLYFAYAKIGWIDTHWPLIIPPIVANTFGTFLLRQFFMTIPKDLEDAAVVDGASHLWIFWRIMLPLSGPVLATLAIFTFMGSWNDFFDPLIYLNRTDNFTLTVGLAFFNDSAATQHTRLMAGVVISLIPMLAVYAFAQKYFTRGITLTGIRG